MRSKAPLLSADIQHTKGKWEWKREGSYASCFRGGQMAMGQATNDVRKRITSKWLATQLCGQSITQFIALNLETWS